MKTTTAQPLATSAAALTAPQPVEVIKPLASIEAILKIEGDRVSIPKGADLSASELALFISDRDSKAKTFGAQARWTFHAAGKLANGEGVQAAIKARLEHMMSKSALSQLTSEAKTLCPLIESEGIKAPLSLLKDAKAELLVNEKSGKFEPMAKQSKAAKALIPLLKSGEITQAKIRELRKSPPAGNGNPTAPKSGPTAKKGEAEKAIEFGMMCGKLGDVAKYLDANKVEGDDRQRLVNGLVDIARKLGMTVS